MNRTDLRLATKELAEKAKRASGAPSRTSVAEARKLFELRKEFLSGRIGSNIAVRWREEPDWNSWEVIAKVFGEYYDALVEFDNARAIPMATYRLRGI